MRLTNISKNNNTKLILFFNGWGMDDRVIAHINHSKYDVVMINEYHDFNFDKSILDGYKETFIVAWSLGVWVANNIIQKYNLKTDKTIAINGTLQPIDNLNGIPFDIFQGTIDNWNESNRTRFQMRMFKSRQIFSQNLNKLPIRSIVEQKEELIVLQNAILSQTLESTNWDKIYCGTDDLIFVHANQKQAWQNASNIIEREMSHFPFLELNNWDTIVE